MFTLFLVVVAALVVVLYALPMLFQVAAIVLNIALNLLIVAAVVAFGVWLCC